jgi:hypothetical protein
VTTYDVTIWHNIATDLTGRPLGQLDGYERNAHALAPVYRYAVSSIYAMTPDMVETFAHEAWIMFCDALEPGAAWMHSTGHNAHARAYNTAGNRMLRIGDVIQVGTRWVSVARFGFTVIEAPTFVAIGASVEGTVSMSREAVNAK